MYSLRCKYRFAYGSRAAVLSQVIDVDPSGAPGDNTMRTELTVPDNNQVVLFDHIARKRG